MIPAVLAPTTLDGLLKDHPSLPGILLAVACLLILFLVVLPRFPSWWRGRGRPVVDPVQVTEMIAGPGALVVDLRSFEAFRTGHIRGSLHVPFVDLARRFAIPDPKAQRSLILVDETDELSHLAFDQLSARGFSWIYVLKGGLKAWRRANFPIAK
jgi:rhodanese-related sulfurtransferase